MTHQRIAWCLDLAGLVILTWQALPGAQPTATGRVARALARAAYSSPALTGLET